MTEVRGNFQRSKHTIWYTISFRVIRFQTTLCIYLRSPKVVVFKVILNEVFDLYGIPNGYGDGMYLFIYLFTS